MENSPTDLPISYYTSADGYRLAWRESGEGRPLVLLHGYFSNAWINWIRHGHIQLLADAGFRVILPDHRAHGDSEKPHDPAAYPPDILARDAMALIARLGLEDFDLGGYSLGARTTARMLALGVKPRRAVMGGMGLSGLTNTGARGAYFRHILTNLGKHKPGSREWMSEAFLKTVNGDPVALLNIQASFVDTPVGVLKTLTTPTLIVCGADDDDNGSAQDLADIMPNATYVEVPGNHMSAVLNKELAIAIRDYLLA